MSNSTKEKPSILFIFAIALFLVIGALQFYVETFTTLFSPYGRTYQYEQSITDEAGYTQTGYVFVEFTDDGVLNMIATDDCFTVINKNSYDYSYRVWNNIGNLYFKTNSLLSVTVFKEDARPITLEMECVQSRGWYSSLLGEFVTYEDADEIGAYYKSEAWFYENSLVLDGIEFQQIEDIDPECREMIRLYIDNDDVFTEYLVE